MSEQHEGATGTAGATGATEEPHEMTREEKVADIKARLDNMRSLPAYAPFATLLHDVFELLNPSGSSSGGPAASSTQAHGVTGPSDRSSQRR